MEYILTINRLWKWSVELWRWIAKGKIIFICLLVIVTTVVLGFFTWHSEVSIRLAGYVLQLIGMIFAIRGLLSIRSFFGQPLLKDLVFNWLKQFPKGKKEVFIETGAFNLSIGIKSSADVWTPDNASQTIEQRIEGIVENLERIRNRQREHANSIDDLNDSYKKHKMMVAEEAKNMKEEIRSDLESLHTSDLITSLVGLIWLTAGITMSTIAPELHQWLHT